MMDVSDYDYDDYGDSLLNPELNAEAHRRCGSAHLLHRQ